MVIIRIPGHLHPEMREPELDDDSSELPDWNLPLAFNDARHAACLGSTHTVTTQTWRMKERVWLILCTIIPVLYTVVLPLVGFRCCTCRFAQTARSGYNLRSLWSKDPTIKAMRCIPQLEPAENLGSGVHSQISFWLPLYCLTYAFISKVS